MPTLVLVTLNETRKGLLITWSYKFNNVAEFVGIGFWFVGIALLMGSGELESARLPSMLLGFLTWYYAAIAIGNMSFGLSEETTTGTLEQMYLSPSPTWVIFLGRVVSTLVVSTVFVAIVGVGLMLIFSIRLPLELGALPVFALTMVGLFGLGYAVAGATLVFKRVQHFAWVITDALLFVNGAMLPVEHLPDWLESVSKWMPTTQGIIVMREIVLEGQSLGAVVTDGGLAILTAQSAIYLVAGWVIFRYSERIAKRRGTLGQY